MFDPWLSILQLFPPFWEVSEIPSDNSLPMQNGTNKQVHSNMPAVIREMLLKAGPLGPMCTTRDSHHQTGNWGKEWTNRMGIVDCFQSNRELELPPAISNMELETPIKWRTG